MNDREKVGERLYLTADKSHLVAEGDPDASILFAAKGREVSAAELERLGYRGAKGGKPEGDKAAKPAGNKAAK